MRHIDIKRVVVVGIFVISDCDDLDYAAYDRNILQRLRICGATIRKNYEKYEQKASCCTQKMLYIDLFAPVAYIIGQGGERVIYRLFHAFRNFKIIFLCAFF